MAARPAMNNGRIAIATEYVGRSGGVSVYVLNLVAALEAVGYEVLVLSGRTEDEHLEATRTVTVPGLEQRQLASGVARRYADALAAFGPDVVHVHHLYDPRIVSLTRIHAPVVWGVHDYICAGGSLYFRPGHECGRAHGPGCVPALGLRGCAHSWNPRGRVGDYRFMSRLVGLLGEVDVALAYSSAVLRNLRANGIDAAEIAPFAPGDGDVYPPGLEDRVLFVGRVTRQKGLGQLIRAVELIEHSTLDVCGDGWWRPTAEKLVDRIGIGDRVRFLGWLDDAELQRAYEHAAVVAVPSVWPEPFGIVGLEAMARGRAVVASRTGGIPDWLVDGVTGVLTEPGDVGALASALRTLLADRELRTRMGAAGAERLRKQFTADRHVGRIEEVNELARRRWARTGVPVLA